jgi:hypothetical protein
MNRKPSVAGSWNDVEIYTFPVVAATSATIITIVVNIRLIA